MELIREYVESSDNDFQQQIDMWDELRNEEEESNKSKSITKDDDDEWCSVKKKDKKKNDFCKVDASKYT